MARLAQRVRAYLGTTPFQTRMDDSNISHSKGPARVLIADDHRLVCVGLENLINAEPDLRVAAVVHDGQGTLQALANQSFDVVLLDMSMPAPSGLTLLRAVRSKHRAVRILIVTFHADAVLAKAAIDAGANGFITKSSTPEQLLQAIREVHKGTRYMDASMMELIVFAPSKPPTMRLTSRETEVFDLLAKGMRNCEIAAYLGLSEKTVSTHRVRLSNKLGAHNLSDLMTLASGMDLPGTGFHDTRARRSRPRRLSSRANI